MMYGTDWSLLLNEGNIAEYLKDFRGLFDKLQAMKVAPPGLGAQFLGGNAAAWLGLKGGRNRDRLDKFYANSGLDTTKYPPPWFNKI